jgi:hypothetical protein
VSLQLERVKHQLPLRGDEFVSLFGIKGNKTLFQRVECEPSQALSSDLG